MSAAERTVIVGDIHGRFAQLTRLLDKLALDTKRDRLILLGDLIDRGPDSYEVVSFVRQLRADMGERLVILRGSHEKLLLDDKKRLSDRLLWLAVGKCASVSSFRRHGAELSDCALWLRENTVLYHEDESFQCAHAGVRYGCLAENDEYTLLMDHRLTRRNLYSGRLTVTGHIHLRAPAYFDGGGGPGKRLEYRRPARLPAKGVICIDTSGPGAGLTAMVVSDGIFYLERV